MTRIRKSAIVFFSGGLWLSAAGLVAQTSGADAARRLVDALDGCVQERFKEVDENLGTARITRPGAPHVFSPERVREVTAVDGLNHARLQVVLYLAGRGVLGPKPPSTPATYRPFISEEHFSDPARAWRRGPRPRASIEWGVIKGPIRVTTSSLPAGAAAPPAALDLWDDTQRAMLSFARSDAYAFAYRDWTLAARPIRVTDRGCLNCHTQAGATLMSAGPRPGNSLRMGDPVGVMLYAYKKIEK